MKEGYFDTAIKDHSRPFIESTHEAFSLAVSALSREKSARAAKQRKPTNKPMMKF